MLMTYVFFYPLILHNAMLAKYLFRASLIQNILILLFCTFLHFSAINAFFFVLHNVGNFFMVLVQCGEGCVFFEFKILKNICIVSKSGLETEIQNTGTGTGTSLEPLVVSLKNLNWNRNRKFWVVNLSVLFSNKFFL